MLLAAAGCVLALPAPGYAADEAQPDAMEAITVTGIRASMQSAIQITRESSDIVEAISSEDIGKLPDPSIAESLTHLRASAPSTPTAAPRTLIGQGLAGTIDLQTTRPLEYGKRTLVLDVRGIKNGNGDLGAGSADQQYRASPRLDP